VKVKLPFGEPCWLATRYEDVRTVYGDRRVLEQFRTWVDTMIGMDTIPEVREQTIAKVNQYVRGLISRRRSEETDDILHVLVHARDDEDRLSEDELFNLSLAVWLGGLETTVNQLGTTLFTLMTHRDHWQELLDDRDLLPAALEELWRWIPSFKYGVPFPRWASEDVEMSDGTAVHAGEAVMPEHAVANRDESVFPHARELDFHRDNPRPYLSLAFGAHRCMGAHLAHLEIQVTLETLLARFPNLELTVPADQVPFSDSTFMRSVKELPLTW
jgi:cytochrome P450